MLNDKVLGVIVYSMVFRNIISWILYDSNRHSFTDGFRGVSFTIQYQVYCINISWILYGNTTRLFIDGVSGGVFYNMILYPGFF